MSVNLKKNKDALTAAWEEVHNPSGKNDWAVFGYDGKSYDLKVVSQGEDGLDEMVDDLSSGKILYAGIRILDPNTNLPKIVFINWQGEGVPANIKGTCANHLRDINGLFRGAHVQINARSEDDVEENVIMEKVKNASGANYSFHKEKPKAFVPQGKIGSVYEKSRADLEIDSKEKDKFWAAREKEDKIRKENEAKEVQNERIKESRQRAEREKKEAEQREILVRERSQSIEKQRRASIREEDKKQEEEKRRYKETLREAQFDDVDFNERTDNVRRTRLEEANQLIRKRQESFGEASPKEVFDKPAVAPPRKAVPLPASKPKKAVPAPVRQPSPEPIREASPEPVREPTPEPVRAPTPEPVREPTPEPVRQPSPPPVRQPSPPPVRDPTPPPSPPPVREATPPPVHKELPQEPVLAAAAPPQQIESHGLTARALYDYQAADESEITFDPGDMITNIEQIDEGWWRGDAPNGGNGLFPANYVELVDEERAPVAPEPTPAAPVEQQTLCARALYDYQAADASEITFDPGDMISNIEQIDEGWWKGTGPDGSHGLFPANYVELIS